MDQIKITLISDDEIKNEIILHKTVEKEFGYYTEWETTKYPLIKIIQEDYHYFKTAEEIEILSGDFSEEDLNTIAMYFNEYIDTFLNRQIYVNVRIQREVDDIPFQHGLITVESYKLNGKNYELVTTQQTLMNNYNGFVQIYHSVNKEQNDRYLKISELEIQLNIPKFHNRNEERFKENVVYMNSSGIFKAISDQKNCPYVDIKVAHINQKIIDTIDLKGELFIGEVIL